MNSDIACKSPIAVALKLTEDVHDRLNGIRWTV